MGRILTDPSQPMNNKVIIIVVVGIIKSALTGQVSMARVFLTTTTTDGVQ